MFSVDPSMTMMKAKKILTDLADCCLIFFAKKTISKSFFLLFLLTSLPLSTANAAKSIIKKVEFSDKNNLKISLTKNTEFKIFTLTKPNRLVIDIDNSVFEKKNYKPRLPYFISSFRSHIDKKNSLRMVFDLKQEINIKNTSLQRAKDRNLTNIIAHFSGIKAKSKQYTPIKKKAQKKKWKKAKSKPSWKSKKVVVIDAGHGGKDPGTIGNYARTKEKNVTLSYARELKKKLDKSGKYRVFLTRKTDYFIPLRQRVQKARNFKADLFISIHANSIKKKSTSGFSIYTLSEKSSDKQAELLARKENRSDIIAGANFSGASRDIMKTLIDMSQRDSMNSSSIFANLVIKSVKRSRIKALQNTHRFAGFAVLTAPDMASVLIELGYLSNKYEERKLNSYRYKRKLVGSIARAVDEYFHKIKR